MGIRIDLIGDGEGLAGSFCGILIGLGIAGVAVAGCAVAIPIDNHKAKPIIKENNALKMTIEDNVVKNELLPGFKLHGIDCSEDENGDYYVHVFGKAPLSGIEDPVFVDLKYPGLDKETYNKINNHLQTVFKFNENGTVLVGSHVVDKLLQTSVEKINRAIFKQVAEITKNHAIEKNIFGASAELIGEFSETYGQNIAITNISPVILDDGVYSSRPTEGAFLVNIARIEGENVVYKTLKCSIEISKINLTEYEYSKLHSDASIIYEHFVERPEAFDVKEIASIEMPITEAQNLHDLASDRDL